VDKSSKLFKAMDQELIKQWAH